MPPLHLIVHPEDREALRAHLAFVAGAGHARTDLRVARADGTAGVYEVESQTLALDGRTRVLSLARDVGARRAHENAAGRTRARAAEEALRVKSAFLASMSHEIRTPLTAVIGYAELLRDEVAAEQQDLVAAIESGGHRLLATLNSVLDLARLDAGRETLRPADVDLVAHVRDGLRLFDALAAKKGLSLVFVPAVADLPGVLDAGALDRDPDQPRRQRAQVHGRRLRHRHARRRAARTPRCPSRIRASGCRPSFCRSCSTSSGRRPRARRGATRAPVWASRSRGSSSSSWEGRSPSSRAPGVGTTFTVRLPLGVAETKAQPAAGAMAA